VVPRVVAAGYLLLAGVFIWVGVERYRRPVWSEPIEAASAGRPLVETRIDPNTATWAELARLPDVGETLARRIVAYREAQRGRSGPQSPPSVVFRSLADLDPIPGLGPKRLERIEPLLRFPAENPPPSQSGQEPPIP